MATSQNGWPVFADAPDGTLKWITGRVHGGDVAVVFDYFCKRFNAEVELIKPSWSWGWSYRAIRGATSGFSNHASATALDINAPAHPLGVNGTFTQAEINRVHEILTDLEGVLRWGQDYTGRKDGMHVEVNVSAARLHEVANKIRKGLLPTQQPLWTPTLKKAVNFGRVQEQFLIAAGADKGDLVRLNGVWVLQKALNKVLVHDVVADGIVGKDTLDAWGRWEDRHGGVGRPRVPDRESVEALSKKAGFALANTPWDE